jgi:tetrahydromethanopterin S-methyltransferase subunit G
MTRRPKRESLTGSKKRKVDEHEIEQIRDGLPKVIEYWEMVKSEMDQLLTAAISRDIIR